MKTRQKLLALLLLFPGLAYGQTPAGSNGEVRKSNAGSFGGPGINDLNRTVKTSNLPDADADFHPKGPNTWYDLSRYGWYASPTYYRTGTTGTMSASSSKLRLANALDFANGQGLVILGVGPKPTISTPTDVTVAAVGATGSTTYYYCVVDEDYMNGRTACSAAGSVANAVATLGIQTNTVTGCSRTSGVVTCSTSAPHNFIYNANHVFGVGQGGPQIEIQNGSTGDHSFEGTFTITSASGSTFTFNQYGVPDSSGTVTGGNARVVGMVAVKWREPTAYTVLKHLVYRCTGGSCALPANAANYNLVGVAQGQDSYFLDRGLGATAANIDNGDASSTAPTATSNGWLATYIISGGGTTTLTLAASSTNAASGVLVRHDNAAVIKRACATIPANTGAATFYAPSEPGVGAFSFAPFSSYFSFGPNPIGSPAASCPGGTEFDFQGPLMLNATMQLGLNITMRGGPGGQTSIGAGYEEAPITVASGYAYPMIYINGQSSTNDFLSGFKINCPQKYQTCLYEDQASNGDGPTDFRYDDVYLSNTNGSSNVYVAKAGFGRFWTRGAWQSSVNDFGAPTAALFTVNCGTGQPQPQWATIGYTTCTAIYGGLLIDGCGVNNSSGGGWTFNQLLTESGYIPAIRANTYPYGVSFGVTYFSYADILGGYSTPAIDLTNAPRSAVTVNGATCATGYQPLFEVGTSGNYPGLQVVGAPCSYLGANNGTVTYSDAANGSFYDQLSWNTRLQNTSHVAYQMGIPGAPQRAVASSGGAVPVGPHTYQFTAVDADGNETTVGPAITGTATTGNQTITVTAPAAFPVGAVGLNLYRDSGMINPNGASCNTPQINVLGGTIADNYLFKCGANAPYQNQAGSSLISSHGLATYKLKISNETLTASPRGEQNIFLPGPLTSTWTGSTWIIDRAITITRVQVQAKTSPSGCTQNAIVRLTDGTTPVNVMISAVANDSGRITHNYAAGAALTVNVQIAAAGCTTSPSDANVTIQYRMQ
ncbi:MAG: hypothetical protein ACHQT6_00975 [Candidatus Acidiferrales bacterium]